ncbi:hypothetical protein [Planctomicrobium sp. SH664]
MLTTSLIVLASVGILTLLASVGTSLIYLVSHGLSWLMELFFGSLSACKH